MPFRIALGVVVVLLVIAVGFAVASVIRSGLTGNAAYLVGLYFAPTIIAMLRRKGATNRGGIFVVNFFLGLTVIGWIVALAMACRSTVTVAPGH